MSCRRVFKENKKVLIVCSVFPERVSPLVFSFVQSESDPSNMFMNGLFIIFDAAITCPRVCPSNQPFAIFVFKFNRFLRFFHVDHV